MKNIYILMLYTNKGEDLPTTKVVAAASSLEDAATAARERGWVWDYEQGAVPSPRTQPRTWLGDFKVPDDTYERWGEILTVPMV